MWLIFMIRLIHSVIAQFVITNNDGLDGAKIKGAFLQDIIIIAFKTLILAQA